MDQFNSAENTPQPPAVIASTKHQLSGKQKLLLVASSVIAFVGVGFGGYSFYNNTILNAAGEASLGNGAMIELPPPTESPYFKVVATGPQFVDIRFKGDASAYHRDDYTDYWLADGYRLEMTSDTTGVAGWAAVASAGNGHIRDQLAKGGIAYDSATYSDTALPLKDTSDKRLMQPNTTYYFRITKNANPSDTSSTWQQQGPALPAKTRDYPKTAIESSGDQVKVAWPGTAQYKYGDGQSALAYGVSGVTDLSYGIARFKDPATLVSGSAAWNEVSEFGSSTSDKLILDTTFTDPDTRIFLQPSKTTYYYAPVFYGFQFKPKEPISSAPHSNVTILRILGAPTMVASGTTYGQLLADVTVPVKSVAWNELEKLSAEIKFKNTNDIYPGEAYADMTLKPTDSKLSASWYEVSAGYGSLTDHGTSFKVVGYGGPYNTMPVGDYTLKGGLRYTLNSQGQRFEVPIKITAAASAVSAKYATTTVKKGSNVSIAITNPIPAGAYVRPTGTIVVKNHKTGKTIKSLKLSDSTTKQTVTFKATDKGKYAIDVVFTADKASDVTDNSKETWPPYFQNKTISLPTLTIK